MATHPTSLLLSKLRPPGISIHSLRRDALIAELIGSSAMAILIEAPAGNGKTTLMEQVYDELRLRNVSTAWLTLDANDNAADEFVHYLVRSLLLAGVLDTNSEAAVRDVLEGRSPRASVAALLAEAAAGGRRGVIFLDDIHQIVCPECLALIKVLLDESTNDLRFVMASRRWPLLDAAKLRLQGTLDLIPAARLNFTLAEAAVFLGRDPADDALINVYVQTRGWPVAVKLLAAALARYPANSHLLANAMADLPDMEAYLSEQVMSDLPATTQRFLMMTSLPERITGDLANKLCDRADGEQTLRQLEREGFFITQAADRRGSYRYHDFFRDFLRSRLAEQSIIDVAALHRRAAEWFLTKGRLEEALKQALEAGAWDLAIAILENEGGWQIALKHGAEVLHGIEAIPAAAMQASLLTRLTLVYVLLHFGQADRAREGFEQLRAESADFTEWRGETIAADVRAECRALEAIIIIDEERPLPVSFVERIKQEACSVGARGRFVRIVTDSGLAIYANYDAGNYRECVQLAEQGFLALKDIHANFGLGYLHLYLGMSHFARGRLHLAQSSYRNALDLAATHFPHESQRIEALACIAECQYYANNLAGARCNVDAALASLRDPAAVDGPVFQVTYLTAAAVYARLEDLDNALSLLLEARAVALYLRREHRLANIDIRRVEELTRGGYCVDAEEIIEQDGFQRALAGGIGDPSCIPLCAMNASLALARFELATHDPAAAQQRLLALEAKSANYQHEILKLKCLTLLMASEFALGDHAAAMQSLRRLSSRIIPLGLKRVIADEKALIQPAFEYALDKAERSGTAAYVNAQIIHEDWLNARDENAQRAQPEDPAPPARPVGPPGVLSPRQREVLELLAAGLSGKEIATRLGLSESTIKSYRKSLYARLRAGRRSQALANARRMSLLP
jgi:LuxR family transcriptional regulator, maltose regulon positive regulatory protein